VLKVYVYGRSTTPAVAVAVEALRTAGVALVDEPAAADLAVAPLLTRTLSPEEYAAPWLGTLIFHPSLLPRHRGRDAIRWALAQGETYTGATWFWAAEGLDTGEICEQEVLEVRPGESPREFYERAVVPACGRLLLHILRDLQAGHVRRRPQREEAATYEPPFPRAAAPAEAVS
jgi:methionyl-tRNA formyltransferase